MRKNVFGRKFKRDTNERKAFFKGLISSLVLKERIITTEARAKAIKPDADKIITKVKRNKDLAKRSLGILLNKEALEKLINDLAPRFADRKGGYTRIIRLGRRLGDDAMEVVIEWTEGPRAVSTLNAQPKTKNQKPKAKPTAQKSKVKKAKPPVKSSPKKKAVKKEKK